VVRRKNPERKMSLGGHLKELRNRLFWSFLFITGGTVGGWYLFDTVYALLKAPIDVAAAKHGMHTSLNFSDVMGAFDLHLQVSVFLGILMTSPIWLYNIWAFITPAIGKRARRYTIAFIFSSVPLFAAGVWLAWVSYPNFINTLLALSPAGSTNIMNAADYMLFALRLLVLFGVAFVSPVALVLLNLAGLITAKNIFASWRLAVVLIAVISAVATPTADPMSMFVLMLPLAALYFASGGVAFITDRRRSRRADGLLQGS
jgi:sec-independent protein translocase protein TatC